MALELTFLGTGTSAGVPMIGCDCPVCTSSDPRDRRDRSSVVLRYPRADWSEDSGLPRQTTVLIDASPDMRHQSIRHGVDWLDMLFLTHAHADHILGIDDLRRFNSVVDGPIEFYAEPEVIQSVRRMFNYIFKDEHHYENAFVAKLIPLPIGPGQVIEVGRAKWTPIRLLHGRLPILGYRIDWNGRSIAYCTDCSTIPHETLAQMEGLDVLVLDGLRERHHPTHMTLDRACEFALEIGARQTYLTHIAHDHSHAELLERLPEGVEPAYDGLTLSLTANDSVIKAVPG
ncbi:MAG: MBL fold metallo-hydrolase [Planctomycetota bacterium]